MSDPQAGDPSVTDPLALAEIELYGELVIAASASSHPLSSAEIDVVLGVQVPGQPKRPAM